jgi:hypothetical protein
LALPDEPQKRVGGGVHKIDGVVGAVRQVVSLGRAVNPTDVERAGDWGILDKDDVILRPNRPRRHHGGQGHYCLSLHLTRSSVYGVHP